MENDILDAHISKDETRYDYAEFGSRFGASLLDGLIVGLPLTGLTLFAYSSKNMILAIVVTLISGLYKPIMESMLGATPGKLILGLKVVDSNFEQVDLVTSFTKNAIYLVTSALTIAGIFTVFGSENFLDAEGILESLAAMGEGNVFSIITNVWSVVIIISCLAMLGDSVRRQTLHDKLAGTFLVKERLF